MIAESQRGNMDTITPVILFSGAEGRGVLKPKRIVGGMVVEGKKNVYNGRLGRCSEASDLFGSVRRATRRYIRAKYKDCS